MEKKSVQVSHGIIEAFSEVTEWKIPDFFLLGKIQNEYRESPRFSSVGRIWYLRVYPKGDRVEGWMSVYLYLDDTNPKMVTYIIGLKHTDDILKETAAFTQNFKCQGEGWGQMKFWDLDDLQKRKSELVPSGILTVTCRVKRQEINAVEEITPNSQQLDSAPATIIELEGLSSDFKSLLSNEKTCDFSINLQGKEFRVHRSVLAARSPFFRSMFEHDTEEAKNGLLNISDCSPALFQEFIEFLYTGKIDVSSETACQLYSTAEKYNVQQLKSFCISYLRNNLSVGNVCKVIILSHQVCDRQLQSLAQDFFNKNSLQIFLTSGWEALLKDNFHLANKVLKEMASAALKNS